MIGTVIDGKYRIAKLLGEGAMGSVYEAEHTATGRRCAIKVISSLDLTRDPKIVQRFQREARAAGGIDTQHITQVLDAGVDRDTKLPFLAMEFLSGEDLQHLLLRTGPLAPHVALRIAVHCCLGLQKAHEAGVVHRDIKPHNLFLARRDAGEIIVKLLDFGIAKVKMDQANDTEGADLTKTGSLVGSPLYMSPEQAVGQREIDHRTDIWSLGAVLYQALSGRTPFHDIKALGQLILSICSSPVPPLQDYAPWVPAEIAAVVHRCLQQDPARRFQSAQELLATLRPMLPYGWAIQEDMLVPLSEAHRHHVAPRLGASGPEVRQSNPHASIPPANASGAYPAVGGGALPSGAYPAVGGGALPSGAYPAVGGGALPSGAYPAAPGANGSSGYPAPVEGGSALRSGAYPAVPAGTQGGLSASRSGGGARLGRSAKGVALVGGVAALGAVVGLGVIAAQRFSATPEVAPAPPITAPEPVTSASQVPPPPPVVILEAQPSTPRPPEEPPERRVRVVIWPEDALVELEGERTATSDGVLEINGRLGRTYKVRVFKGSSQVTTEIAITEGGAYPAKVELPIVHARPGPAPKASAAPAPTPTTTRPAVPPGFTHDTDEFK
ncbi:serine/threonine protein kinase [Sorangium sp. So ce513]|uniref:serine/threonine protein kinase n=1 Tax=Sorangium sp. So ce513 TaxID=3133315 RepID=UPI003F60286D